MAAGSITGAGSDVAVTMGAPISSMASSRGGSGSGWCGAMSGSSAPSIQSVTGLRLRTTSQMAKASTAKAMSAETARPAAKETLPLMIGTISSWPEPTTPTIRLMRVER